MPQRLFGLRCLLFRNVVFEPGEQHKRNHDRSNNRRQPQRYPDATDRQSQWPARRLNHMPAEHGQTVQQIGLSHGPLKFGLDRDAEATTHAVSQRPIDQQQIDHQPDEIAGDRHDDDDGPSSHSSYAKPTRTPVQ